MKCANPLCLGVELKEKDQYCPWCGEPVSMHVCVQEFEVSQNRWQPLRRFFKEERPKMRLVLEGLASDSDISGIQRATTDADWLAIGEWQRSADELWAEVTYLPDELAESEAERSECASISAVVAGDTLLRTEVEAYPYPSFALDQGNSQEHPQILLKDNEGLVHLHFTLKRCGNVGPSQARVVLPAEYDEDVKQHPVQLNWLDGAAHLCGEIVYTARGGDSEVYPIELHLKWRGRIGADAERPLEFTQSLPIFVRVVGRPQLKVLGSEGRTSWSVLTNRPSAFALTVEFTNRGHDSRLLFKEVRLGQLPENLKVELCGDLVAGGEIVNVGGKAEPHAIVLRLKELPEVGNYDFVLIAVWYDPDAQKWQQYERLIGLRVGKPQVLPGSVLSLDFGTSSSCVAMWGLRALPEMIVVEPERGKYRAEDPYSLASVALYMQDCVEIGEKARRLAFHYPLAVLESPKRDIGRRQHYDVMPQGQSWVNVDLIDVVEMFYTRLILSAQDSVALAMGTAKDDWTCINFENLAVSYPSRFSYAQRQVLKEGANRAFSKVFADTEVRLEMVQEPLAAALSYLSDASVQEKWHEQLQGDDIEYSMLVYDCGGGTTDLCCLKVHSLRKKLQRIGVTDFAQLTDYRREELLPSALVRLCPRASSPEVEGWCQAVRECPDWTWAWEENEALSSLPFGAEDLVQALVASANEASEDFSYTVEVRILGASGDPSFGGSNITEEITDILRERFPRLIVGEQKNADLRIKSRRNAILLQRLAEELKCSLGEDSAELASRLVEDLQGTLVTADGNVSESELKGQIEAVSKGLYRRLRLSNGGAQTGLANLGDECRQLAQRCLGHANLAVVLLTGRGSQWPGIRESLVGKFPDVPIVSLGNASVIKHCVARGAGVLALVKSGASLADGPGVHIVDIAEEVYTTCSLMLQRGTELVEIIGAGCHFGEEDTIVGSGELWLHPEERRVEITVYRSDVPGTCQGDRQTMQREGATKVGTFAVEIPEGNTGRGQVRLVLTPSQSPGRAVLRVELEVHGQSYEGQPSDGTVGFEVEVFNR